MMSLSRFAVVCAFLCIGVACRGKSGPGENPTTAINPQQTPKAGGPKATPGVATKTPTFSGTGAPKKVTDRWHTSALKSPLDDGKSCAIPLPEVSFSLDPRFSLSNAFLVSHFMLYDIDSRWVETNIRAQLTAVGFESITFIPEDVVFGEAIRGFVAVRPDFVYVHVKGTTGAFGWMQNAKTSTWPADDLFSNGGWQHVGFRDFYRALVDKWNFEGRLRALTDGTKPVLFSGHSQGGAIALIAAARAKQSGENVLAVYTQGQPRAGDGNFSRRLGSILTDRVHRLTFKNDLVPHLPPTNASADSANAAMRKITNIGIPLGTVIALANYGHVAGRLIDDTGAMSLVTEAEDATSDNAFWTRLALPNGTTEVLSADRVVLNHYPEVYHCALARALVSAGN